MLQLCQVIGSQSCALHYNNGFDDLDTDVSDRLGYLGRKSQCKILERIEHLMVSTINTKPLRSKYDGVNSAIRPACQDHLWRFLLMSVSKVLVLRCLHSLCNKNSLEVQARTRRVWKKWTCHTRSDSPELQKESLFHESCSLFCAHVLWKDNLLVSNICCALQLQWLCAVESKARLR